MLFFFFLFYSVSVSFIVFFLLCVAYDANDASEVRCAVVVGAILQRVHACPIRESGAGQIGGPISPLRVYQPHAWSRHRLLPAAVVVQRGRRQRWALKVALHQVLMMLLLLLSSSSLLLLLPGLVVLRRQLRLLPPLSSQR